MDINSFTFDTFRVALERRDDSYKGKNIKTLYDAIISAAPDVQEAIEDWIMTGNKRMLESHGETTLTLISRFKMKYCAAALTIDWIRREPGKALNTIAKGIL